ncbi:MAG: helix-turn-helix transcriptional regulator [Rubrivivax sp.]|nr:helix-turn-helix transcriptional regulator [Rubrivivax sp.]MDH5338875.1 helix-turn-helix transcriptional regulator [Rubrivivax sp.]
MPPSRHRPHHRLPAPADAGLHAPTTQRPVRAKARRLQPDSEIQPHCHPWAQVAIAVSGVARITADATTYLVPAWRAIWIPPGVEHVVSVVEATELRSLYVHQPVGEVGPRAAPAQHERWRRCRVLEVSPLLRELVLQMAVDGDDDPAPGPEALAREHRLGDLVLDEMRRAKPVPLGIALPRDARLRALCLAVLAAPTRHATLAEWAAESGASARTVARLFRSELGTSFGPWREQVLLGRAMTLAAQGRPMGLIAADLGYASASAFGAMVRRSVGLSPGRFFGGA